MLQFISEYITFNLLEITPNTRLGEVVNFFVYDSIKILLLIIVITHLMGLIRYYLPTNKIKRFLTEKKLYFFDYILAALFGSVTPFCSCSSIPLFIGFLEAGIPLGVTFSFLITSPLINEVALALFISLFGWQVTVIYLIGGILVGVIGGYILGKLKMEKYVEDYVLTKQNQVCDCANKTKTKKQIYNFVSTEAWKITKKITPYVLGGVLVGALIHGYVPQGYFEKYITADNLFAVPLAVILAVPLYSNASGVIPIIQSLVDKGIPLGTALAFMMAVVGLSLPEALILKKVMKPRLLLTFFGVVTLGIIILGYIFNLIQI